MTAARYGMREVEGSPQEAWAQNPKQSLNSRFDETGLRLVVKAGPEERYPSRWELKSVADEAVPSGTLQRAGQKLELERAELGLTEWYVNRPSGLEHGFTLERRPEAAGELLELTLAVTGRLGVRAEEDGQSLVVFQKENNRTLLNYGGLKVWDAEGKDITARMETNATGDEVRYLVEDIAATYPLTIDPTFLLDSTIQLSQEAYLKASNSDELDQFGGSVAISGDTIVVGAFGEDSEANGIGGDQMDNSASSVGAVYVFVRSGDMWSQEAYLKASNSDESDLFGESVAISGDTIVVGARGEDSGANGVNGDETDNSASLAGAAYVFVRNGSTWSQQAYLKASNSEAFDRFGNSVTISGDTLVVGAIDEDSGATGIDGDQMDNSATGAGAVYVFVRNGSVWSQAAYLKASNPDELDLFGRTVSISGDTIVVGVEREDSNADGVNGDETDNSASLAGAAYVFVRNGSTWSQQAYLKASNSDADDEFGNSVAISGDTIVVGAEREDSGATGVNGDQLDNSALNAGAAYVFVRNGSTWSQQAYLKASNTDENDNFGRSVAISGDTIVVGASKAKMPDPFQRKLTRRLDFARFSS